MVLLSEIGTMMSSDIPATSRIESLTTIGCAGVVLESLRVGERRFTSIEALGRFADRLVMRAADDWPGILLRTLGVN
ncbi:MAG: DUF1580 domain-containing protein [Planctomycetes bacterium]|nr:DUF1580 domain-containing protein [Planctomycetota bacterium]